jgi:lipoprotein-anchoring transpeptidase ErfK/SrfK
VAQALLCNALMWISACLTLLITTTAAPAPKPSPAARPDAIVRLQVLLDRAHFSSGEIDGQAGQNLRAAVRAFKTARLNGAVLTDAEVAEALALADGAPVLTTYVVTAEDADGPFVVVPTDMMKQAELPALGFATVLELLGEKFHSSPKLLQRLNPGKKFTAGDEIQVPNVQRIPVGKAAKVVVNTRDQSVTALDAQGGVLARYPATLGGANDPLPLGNWKINGVSRNPPFHYNPDLFWDSKPEHAKAVIKPGPNNPVGVVWIDLSKESMGIHGTAQPSLIGKRTSHGCIRLTNWDASELADLVSPGIPALLVEN